ncbi:hypothetical protein HYW35_02360 [Candidatus Saccharibacteria bacterium]|nr:hypothetical protein [Candidatus Saccharibacteria bacterium]
MSEKHPAPEKKKRKLGGLGHKVLAAAGSGVATITLMGGPNQTQVAHARIFEGGPNAPLINKGGPKPNHPLSLVANRPSKFMREEINAVYTEIYKSPVGEIKIIGNDNFIEQTKAALDLLQSKAPDYFKMVVDNMGIILRVKSGSSIQVEKTPPRFFASDRLFEAGTAWFASTMVHDGNHALQYRKYEKEHPGQVVPEDVFFGEKAELECIAIQADALTEIGAPQWQIDWLTNYAAQTKYWNIPNNQHDW